MYIALNAAVCFFFGSSQNVKIRQVSKNISADLFTPFLKSTLHYSRYT